ncbi:MAG: large conductance mechanosensitive channel protein MscL [Chloroflexaceae bacterium]
MLKGFRDFILRGNVVDLAVAVVIGAAFGEVVNGFIAAFIDPLIALMLGGAGEDLASIVFAGFPVGLFLSALVTFLFKAAVVYFFIVRPFARVAATLTPASGPADDVKLLTEIRDLQRQQVAALQRGERM